MNRFLGSTVFAALAATATHASAAVLVVDNFESYANNQAIATASTANPPTVPWLRFGTIGDNLVAKNTGAAVLSGLVGAQIPITVSGVSSASVRKGFTAATDFSSYATASVLTKSLGISGNAASTASTIQLSIANATTNFFTTLPQAESTTAQTMTFGLDAALFTRGAGTDSFAAVLAGATSIGFRVINANTASETLAFDDFALATAVPEPTTLGAIGAAAVALLARRRRA